jgi:hypothetical protein
MPSTHFERGKKSQNEVLIGAKDYFLIFHLKSKRTPFLLVCLLLLYHSLGTYTAFSFYKLIGKLTALLQLQDLNSYRLLPLDFRHVVFTSQLKNRVGLSLDKKTTLKSCETCRFIIFRF